MLKQFQQMHGFFLPVPLLILAVIHIVSILRARHAFALGILGVLSLGVLLERRSLRTITRQPLHCCYSLFWEWFDSSFESSIATVMPSISPWLRL
jgi:hypothetical protein